MKRKWVLALCVGAAVLAAGSALATPGSMAVGEVLARGTLADSIRDKLKLARGLLGPELRSSTDVVVQKITIQPGGHTGWHTHPAPVLVVVKAGALTFHEADCLTTRTYTAGQAFIDQGGGHVHLATNQGSTALELWATYIVPGPAGSPFRLDADRPEGCTIG